jgi:hypothetical protein
MFPNDMSFLRLLSLRSQDSSEERSDKESPVDRRFNAERGDFSPLVCRTKSLLDI